MYTIPSSVVKLPSSVVINRKVDLLPAQLEWARRVKTESPTGVGRWTHLTSSLWQHQITSGFFSERGQEEDSATTWIIEPSQSPKFLTALDAIEEIISEGRSVVVWAKFRPTLEAFGALLAARFEYDVADDLSGFIAGRGRILLTTPARLGTGTNGMTVAADMIWLELDWSFIKTIQSFKRCHRSGQQHTVRTLRLLGAGSIDERIWDAVKNKRDFSAEVTKQ